MSCISVLEYYVITKYTNFVADTKKDNTLRAIDWHCVTQLYVNKDYGCVNLSKGPIIFAMQFVAFLQFWHHLQMSYLTYLCKHVQGGPKSSHGLVN